MYGHYSTPLKIARDNLSITFENVGGTFIYRRFGGGGEVEKTVLEGPEKIIISPVEPLNLPKRITPYLLIEFSRPIVIVPSGDETVFLKFPAEIGVFLSKKRDTSLLDTISLNRQKFTLYGSPRGGSICRFWESEVFSAKPAADPLLEGVLALRITSQADAWVTAKRVVLDAHGMKLRYTDNLIATKGEMKILSDEKAETGFVDTPFQQGMQKTVELFRLGKLAVTSARYTMSEGL